MAGVLKVRDTDGTSRTVTAPRVRDTDGTSRPLVFIRVRDTDNTVREVFTANGGGGANPASINPPSMYASGRTYTRSASFTASSSGAAPTKYTWGLLDGNGTVASGADQATATLSVYCDVGDFSSNTFFCDMVIGGTTYRARCQFDYSNSGTGKQLQ